jgi:hypothetical protein
LAVIAALITAAPAMNALAAQSFTSRIDAVRDGSVEFTFATRPGVCGDGRGSVLTDNGQTYSAQREGYTCITGPTRVTVGKSEGQVVSIRSCVACSPRNIGSNPVDLGDVPAADASRYLIRVAKMLGGSSASSAVSAATFADAGDLAPELTALVRDDDATIESRKSALFWLGQTDTRSEDIIRLYPTLKPLTLREEYTFVLSQRHDDDVALGKLIDVAGHDSDMQVRKQAMFWLGQSKNPKAIKFFQSILTR